MAHILIVEDEKAMADGRRGARRTGDRGETDRVDFERFTARDGNGAVELTHKEFELLRYLLDNPSRPVGRNELLDRVWGYDALPSTRTVDNFIARLRKRIEPDPENPRIILTAHGIGYKFVPQG